VAGRQPSRDERALWRRATRDVLPLAEIPAALPPQESASEIEPAAPPLPPPRARVAPRRAAALPALTPATAPGVDRRTAERLRRGELPIEARLDLHGMTQEEAHGALDAFLARAVGAGQRCVLVITGKGRRRRDAAEEDAIVERAGVLRSAVPRWLNEAPNRARLLAFAPARPQHGGGGALYLLLRRRR
jgi:DNA-nicking Smr family endonuclease